MPAERRDRLLARFKQLCTNIPIDPSILMLPIFTLDNSAEETVTRLVHEQKAKKSISEKRDQTILEKLIDLSPTPVQIPDEVTAELEQLGEDQNIETRIDKISQRKAEHMPTQTHFTVLNLILDILRNQPVKQAPTLAQKTAPPQV
jgi:hypothetical protein